MSILQKKVLKDIHKIERVLIEYSFCIDQNHHFLEENSIKSSGGSKDVAYTLKQSRYDDIYSEILKNKDYSFLMLDYGIVQITYNFLDDEIIYHRLAYFPSPNLDQFSSKDNYEELFYGYELFSSNIYKDNIITPVRFDFSSIHDDILHPKSHFTIGGYKNCRIPTEKPVDPITFIEFILLSFYHKKYIEDIYGKNLLKRETPQLSETISVNEKARLHVGLF